MQQHHGIVESCVAEHKNFMGLCVLIDASLNLLKAGNKVLWSYCMLMDLGNGRKC